MHICRAIGIANDRTIKMRMVNKGPEVNSLLPTSGLPNARSILSDNRAIVLVLTQKLTGLFRNQEEGELVQAPHRGAG